ncbi:MAG: hypothetical protein WC947_10335 [Elusimicrobiota bacterium]
MCRKFERIKKYILIVTLGIFFTGCVSTQLRYIEKRPRQSIVEEYTVAKKKKETWKTLKTKSFPLGRYFLSPENLEGHNRPIYSNPLNYFFLLPIDIALLPLQTLYDGIFSYETTYETQLVVSGKLMDETGRPIMSEFVKLLALGQEDNIRPDTNGNYKITPRSIVSNKLDNTQEIVLEISNVDNEIFSRGEKLSVVTPLKIKYIIASENKKVVVKKLALNPHIVEGDKNNRAVIEPKWENWVLSGNIDIIKLNKFTLFSEKNLKITKQEEAAEEKRRKQEEAAREKRRIQEKEAEKKIGRINNYSSYEVLNWKPSDEDDIFQSFRSNLHGFDSNFNLRSLIIGEQNELIYTPIPIYQVIDNRKLLFSLGNMIVMGELASSCMKRDYYDGQTVEIVAITRGVYSYDTSIGTSKTVPKIVIYAIRPFSIR